MITKFEGCRAARLRVIFRLPRTVDNNGLPMSAPANWPTDPLAYVQWYTPFRKSPEVHSGMYRVEPSVDSKGVARGSIIALSDIRQTCMLTPGQSTWDQNWSSINLLDKCSSFVVNNLQSKYAYQTIY